MKPLGVLARGVGPHFVICIALFSTLVCASSRPTASDNACVAIREALNQIRERKPGDSRVQLERSFELDGGLQVSSNSRYVFKKCPYIKVDVEFSKQGMGNGASAFLPDDKIVNISRLYLEYPVGD